MLTHHRCPISLALISTDLPILSTIETSATLYQKDHRQFHLLLDQSDNLESGAEQEENSSIGTAKQLLWLEISPSRVIMTLQGKEQFCYRHFWETGIYGLSRYWLNNDEGELTDAFRLRNYTRSLSLEGKDLPDYLRVEYELWSGRVQMGNYILHLEVHH
ncbi:conserved hypothetical protein [Rippkaea orientalis PCC 8801]|uniref:Uncharacterized protein n=1 Tax=Rippkaea orientalis (strain PCC 8801 / RF-1) TaxID=41431 RepID=B7JY12_RIPO1|nr:hypothetical protein [Rippkaea orientalis]ACK65976.1 conserved hypothetical protein [Rippkaea orientalis PCC 8801]